MPEERDYLYGTDPYDVSPYALGFNEWLVDFSASIGREGPDSVDMMIIIMNCIAKMRGVLKPDEVKEALVNSYEFVESRISDNGTILAEHWRDLPDGRELYDATIAAEIPDDIRELDNAGG